VLIHRFENFRARPDLIRDTQKSKKIEVLFNTEVLKLIGNDKIEAVEVQNTKTNHIRQLPGQLVVAKIGMAPNSELFEGQVKMNRKKHIAVDQYMRTSEPGVFAIGDLTFPNYWRIGVAVGQGLMAAREVINYLSTLP